MTIGGERHVLKLTLGALAELEEALGTGSLVELAERFEGGRVSVRDVLAVLVAGLRGGGWRGQAKDLMQADIEGGPLAAAKVAGDLLIRAFAFPADTPR